MPSHDESDVPRPPTVKADDLKSMELVDDEDEGWAGHHEEVDYSKEVIFSDSSDDEATPRDSNKVCKRCRERGENARVIVIP